MSSRYTADDIDVLEGLEAVRKRPGMYVGDSGSTGLHHCLWEVVDNSVDEAMAGYGSEIVVALNADGSVDVEDSGRGIPVGINKKTGKSALEMVFTMLHAGGKFNSNSYSVSGGLHGVGASAANALSAWMNVSVCRDGERWEIGFEKGKVVKKVEKVGKCRKRGTKVSFMPDAEIFKESIEFSPKLIEERLKRASYLTSGIKFVFKNKKEGYEKVFFSESDGLGDFVKELGNNHLAFPPIGIKGKIDEVAVEASLSFSEKSYDTKVVSFVNGIYTKEGGSHESGAMTGFVTALTQKMKEKKDKRFGNIRQEDIKEGLIFVISVKMPEVEFKGQTKSGLNNLEAKKATTKVVKEKMLFFLEENPLIYDLIVEKAVAAKEAREAARASRDRVRKSKSKSKSVSVLPGKLADCRSNNPEEAELYLVEGESAGGSAKQARDRNTQAILPLKGKILNIEKSTLDKIKQNKEIADISTALGIHIGEKNISSLRYHKIIIMTDADVDGGHICFLLLLVFFKYYREIIKNGHLYIAVPPLYRVKKGTRVEYLENNNELERFFSNTKTKALNRKLKSLLKSGDGEKKEEVEALKKELHDVVEGLKKGWSVTRFKGLGEMNPDQLAETAMDPNTRRIVQVSLSDENEVADMVSLALGGKDTRYRKKFLIEHTTSVFS